MVARSVHETCMRVLQLNRESEKNVVKTKKSLIKSHVNFFVFTTLFSYARLRHFRRAHISWSVHEMRVHVLHLNSEYEKNVVKTKMLE